MQDLKGLTFNEPTRPFRTVAQEQTPGVAQRVLEAAYEAIRVRLGGVRSRRALVQRFCLRAQLYDARELRAIAARKTRPEDALADRLARFLFDQGLNPLTRPLVGSLEPDLLDAGPPWTLYVEAKQYKDTKVGRHTIVKGMRQVWDTLARLQGRLAEAVLPQPAVLLALQALDGDSHALDRALKLAQLVDATPRSQAPRCRSWLGLWLGVRSPRETGPPSVARTFPRDEVAPRTDCPCR